MGFGQRQDGLGDVGSRLVAAGCEAGPVVEVDDADGTVRVNDAVTAVDDDVEFLGSAGADVLELLEVDVDALGVAVDFFPAILAVTLVEGVEPVEELRILDAVEFHQITLQVHIDDGAGDATVEVLLKHFLGLLGVTHVAHVLLVHGVEVAALDPAGLKARLLELGLDILVGIDNQALGIRDAVAQQDAGHALAGAVLDAGARVDHQPTLVLKALQLGDAGALSAHGEDDRLLDFLVVELLLAIDVDLATALAQLLGHEVENGRVVTDVIGRISPRAHNARNSDVCHYILD